MKEREQRLKLRQIEVFLVAARHGNFGDAARALAITPSALSQTIADLEHSIGDNVRLFARDQSGARLTVQGQLLVERGGRLLGAEEEARNAIANAGNADATVFRIAYDPSFAGLARGMFDTLVRGHDRLRLEAVEADSDAVAQKVQSGDAELGLAYLPSETGDALETEAFASEPLCVLSSLKYTPPQAIVPPHQDDKEPENAYVMLEALADAPFAFPWFEKATAPELLPLRRRVEGYFQAHNFKPRRVVFRGSDLASVLEVIRAGVAIAILGRYACLGDVDHLDTWPIRPAPELRPFGTLRKKGVAVSVEAAAFGEGVRHELSLGDTTGIVLRTKDRPGTPALDRKATLHTAGGAATSVKGKSRTRKGAA